MKSKLIAAVVAAGLAGPAASSTTDLLDFTSSSINVASSSGTTALGIGYTIIASPGGSLSDATHFSDTGCDAGTYAYACDANGDKTDVGFGVTGGGNDNEIDGIDGGEYVEVRFNRVVQILGFAGMLTYDDSLDSVNNTETADLWWSLDGSTFTNVVSAAALFDDNDPATGTSTDNTFNTVGLAEATGLAINVRAVRFMAGGTGTFDDGNANITAAALEMAPIPLPAAGWMLLAGIGGLFGLRRFRKITTA